MKPAVSDAGHVLMTESNPVFRVRVSDVSKLSVLVPGAGLGRLAWEIARLGYMCQGNEWSFFMLFSSNFVLNRYELMPKLCMHICMKYNFDLELMMTKRGLM